MKKTTEEKRNISIEEITRLEAETIGLIFFSKSQYNPLQFGKGESETKYQNLLSGNDRSVNREAYVEFERRNRDIIEYLVRKIIARGQSVFMAGQTDSGMKSFFKDESKNRIGLDGKSEGTVPDYRAESTDWISYFSVLDSGEIPDSLSEDSFIKSVYEIFSYDILPLRLECHADSEGKEELEKIVDEHSELIRFRMFDFDCNIFALREMTENPSDIEELKKNFKDERYGIFKTFEEFRDVIRYLFGFYSKLCRRIHEYETQKEEKFNIRKWPDIFRKCAYRERISSSNGCEYDIKNEEFWTSLEALRSPYAFRFIENEFKGDEKNEFIAAFRMEGAASLIQKLHVKPTADSRSFIKAFVNGLIETANSLSSSEKAERINDFNEISDGLKRLEGLNCISNWWKKNEATDDEATDDEKTLCRAIHTISSQLRSCEKKHSEKINGMQWFEFMKSLVNDREFCMDEKLKTENFVLFQEKLMQEGFDCSFKDFTSQLTGIFEGQGFVACIDLALKNLELREKDCKDECIQEYARFKTSIDFIRDSLEKIRKNASEEIKKKRGAKKDYDPYFRHRDWNCFIGSQSFSIEEFPKRESEHYFDEEAGTSKWKYDGKTSFKPINIEDFTRVFYDTAAGLPKTFRTALSDIFHLYAVESIRSENTLLDKYRYSGLMMKNPFIHSTPAMFYRFLYGFFTLLRTNISTLNPYCLSQKNILEYSLSSYVADYIYNDLGYEKKPRKEKVRHYTLATLFARHYFEKKGDRYVPSMKNANRALKNAAEKAGLKKGECFIKLANLTDTKRKGDSLVSMPTTSSYVLNEVLSNDGKFPDELPACDVIKFRMDYLNYYLLSNFINALKPFFDERTDSLVSEIVSGVLSYPFYNPDGLKDSDVKSGFDCLLKKGFHRNYGDYESCNVKRNDSFIRCPEYFWYAERKDDRLLKSIYRYGFIDKWNLRFEEAIHIDDMELGKKQAEIFRQELGDGSGDFYFNYYMGKIEWLSFKKGDPNASVDSAIEYYDKAFKFIYNAGVAADDFISSASEILFSILDFKALNDECSRMMEDWKKSQRIEDYFNSTLEWKNRLYGFDIKRVRNASPAKLKRIWQWAEAAGVVGRSYERMNPRNRNRYRGPTFENSCYARLGNDDSKIVKNFESLIEGLEKED